MQKTFETTHLPITFGISLTLHTILDIDYLSHNQACFSSMACKAFKMISEALSPKEEPIPQKSNRLAKKFWFWPPLATAFVFSPVCFFCFAFLHQMLRCKSNIPMVVVRWICSNEEVVCVSFGETYLNAKKEKQFKILLKTQNITTLCQNTSFYFIKRGKYKNKQIFYK